MLKNKIYFEVKDYCRMLLTEKLSAALCFHNLSHTQMVVNAAQEIGQEMQLHADDIEVIVIAAWFHDTGFIRAYCGHEEESCNIAARFLLKNKYDLSKTERVLKCIMATKIDHQPQDITEKILADADLYHLSGDDYFHLLQSLRKERELIFDNKMSDDNWHLQNLDFLNRHNYATVYGQKQLEKGKQKNIQKTLEILEGIDA